MTIVIGLFNYQKNTFDSRAPSLSWQSLWISVTSIVCHVIGIYQRECQGAVFVVYATVGVFTTKSIEFIINTNLGKPNERRNRS